MGGRAVRGAALRAALTDALAREGPMTRAQLAAVTGAPASSVVDAVRAMIASGAVEEVPGARTSRSGRPSALLRAVVGRDLIGVVVLDRHELRVATVDHHGSVRAHARTDFDPHGDDGPFGVAAGLLADVARGDDVRCVVVGTPFPVHDGRRSWPHRPRATRSRHGEPWAAWTVSNLQQRFSDAFGLPVLVENDANLAALGEARAGAGTGASIMIGLKVAGALGAGVVIDQRLIRGAAGFAGELAHTQLDRGGPLCSCGSRGCLATQTGWDDVVTLTSPAFRDELTHDDVLALAADGDRGVRHLLMDHGHLIGEVLAPACVLLNPDMICVDARLGGAVEPVIAGIVESLARRAPGVAAESVRVVPGLLDGDAEFFGAAALAAQAFRPARGLYGGPGPVDRRHTRTPVWLGGWSE